MADVSMSCADVSVDSINKQWSRGPWVSGPTCQPQALTDKKGPQVSRVKRKGKGKRFGCTWLKTVGLLGY